METNLAPVQEQALSADAWERSADALNLHAVMRGRITQTELERMEAEFLAGGGQIDHVPIGKSGESTGLFNSRIVSCHKTGLHTAEEIAEHERKRLAKIYQGDSDLVAKVAVNLPVARHRGDLCTACHCSNDKIIRILKTYFADDPLAKPFLPMNQADKEAMVIREYPDLINKMAQSSAAKAMHISHVELKRIVALHGLKPAQEMMTA